MSVGRDELDVLLQAREALSSVSIYIDGRSWCVPRVKDAIKAIDSLLEPLRPVCHTCGHKGELKP